MDDNEELAGEYSKLEAKSENMVYEGAFSGSAIHGKGHILHTDTKNLFEGEFRNGSKYGYAKFTLHGIDENKVVYDKEKLENNQENGQIGVFHGIFKWDKEDSAASSYG